MITNTVALFVYICNYINNIKGSDPLISNAISYSASKAISGSISPINQSINEDLTSGSSPEGDVRDVPFRICNYKQIHHQNTLANT